MEKNTIFSISPIDGRYYKKTKILREFFSEFALIKTRVYVEIKWFLYLSNNSNIKDLPKLSIKTKEYLDNIIKSFNINDALDIKNIENNIKHDVKSVEYFLKKKFLQVKELEKYYEFIHFGCTSEDINSTSYAILINNFLLNLYFPIINKILNKLKILSIKYSDVSMLSRTHGQPASPTTLGKEFSIFYMRLKKQFQHIKDIKIFSKFSGAVGNFNAHNFVYPNIAWDHIAEKFIKSFNISYQKYTTQIEPSDFIAEIMHSNIRINNILIDLNRDMWLYISLKYFSQKKIDNEIGSSTMPHKINPINFENSEGNLGLSNTISQYIANSLTISRLQRDLSNSTIQRNIGSNFAYSYIAYNELLLGLDKIVVNKDVIMNDLKENNEILAEPIQTIMRKYNIYDAYEKLKNLTRGKKISKELLKMFCKSLKINKDDKEKLEKLDTDNYIGYAKKFAKEIE